eukprot:51042_1
MVNIFENKVTHRGKYVTLKPLDVDADAAELYSSINKSEYEWMWDYMFMGPFENYNQFEKYLRNIPSDWVSYVVIYNQTNSKIGIINYLNIIDRFKTIEIGGLWYAPKYHGTYVSTECTYLLTKYAFDILKYRRVQWKCDNANLKSKKAALRLGFRYEGLLRNHMIYKHKNRDTAYFSMITDEWQLTKRYMEYLLTTKVYSTKNSKL